MLRIRQTWREFFVGRAQPALAYKLPVDRINESTTSTPRRKLSINILPAEVIDQIFDQFDGDTEAIKACTLVCQRWLILSQPRLYHSITLSTQDLEHSLQLQKFILNSPHIRPAVREVSVHFPDVWPADRKWAANLVGDILEILPRPESLKLYGPRSSDRIRWTRLPQHLKNSIGVVLRRQSLASFLIDGWVLDVNIAEFNNIFSRAPSLRSLSLLDISEGLWGGTDCIQPPIRRLLLEELTISNTFAKDFKLIEWLCKPESIFDLGQLKALHIMESRDDLFAAALISAIGPSLERLSVNISYTTEDSINLNQNVALRYLDLSFGVSYTELYSSGIPWICETLDTIPSDNHIEEIGLSLYITHPRNTNVRVFPPPPLIRFNYERWARLGNVLSSPKFAPLSQITIELIHHGIDARAYSAIASQRMGGLNAALVWRFIRDDSPDGVHEN